MAIYQVDLYMTETGIYHKPDNNKWKVYIQKEKDDNVATEIETKDSLPIFIKADREETYFPQPQDISKIAGAIENYGFCLYVLESDLIKNNEVNIKSVNISADSYPYLTLREIKQDLDNTLETKQKVAIKMNKLI